MTSTAISTTAQRDVTVGSRRLAADEAGTGEPVVVLHHSTGPMWTPYLDRLAESRRVIAVHIAGYGRSERPSAARSPADLAVLALQQLDQLVPDPVDVVGLGFGGWVAAEMAAMFQRRFRSITLVGAAGLKPADGFIHDPMMTSFEDYVRFGFKDQARFEALFGTAPAPEIVELWDFSREMTARVTWKQWMWRGPLPQLLEGVRIPGQVIWGDDDRIVPASVGRHYAQLLEVPFREVADAGHNVDLEQPDALAALTTAPLTSGR